MAEATARPAAGAATSPTLIEIDGLSVYYRTVAGLARAVDDVSLTVRRGEILGLAGESGCGKTTLASALLRLTRPPGFIAGGQIRFHTSRNGVARAGQPPAASTPASAPSDSTTGPTIDLLVIQDAELRRVRWRHLAYVPQGSMNSLNPVMRVIDQFADVIVEHGTMPREEVRARVPELLRQVGLGAHVARMFPHELSGGMKQRVIIAMAIALQPDLVIADEPTTALDVNVQRVIIQSLADLRDRLRMSLIVITHDMAVHAELADRVALMYAGKVVEVADVRDIYKQPRHPYTHGLIHAIPQIGGARSRLDGIAGNAPSPTAWPPGCRFHPRCPRVMPVCQTDLPELRPVPSAGRGGPVLVACHLYPEPPRGASEAAGRAAPERQPERRGRAS